MSRIAAAVLAAAVLTGCSSAVSGAGAPAATASGTSAPTIPGCPGSAVAAAGKDLKTALATTTGRDASFRVSSDEPLTLDKVLSFESAARRADLRTELTAAGFENGYLRIFVAPGSTGREDSEAITVHHFTSRTTPAPAAAALLRKA